MRDALAMKSIESRLEESANHQLSEAEVKRNDIRLELRVSLCLVFMTATDDSRKVRSVQNESYFIPICIPCGTNKLSKDYSGINREAWV